MRLTLNGKINTLYVQSLCMMFFRGEKFPLNEENPRGELDVTVIEAEGGIECRVAVVYDGERATDEYFAPIEPDEGIERTIKIATGHAVFRACSRLTGYMPPWGLLTGIRPSVVASELVEKNGEKKALELLMSRYLLSRDKAELVLAVAKNEREILEKYDHNTCSIYISIPFCPTRCSYCSFISYATKKLFQLIPQYVERMVADIKSTVALIKSQRMTVKTVYVGGGTPTTLSSEQLETILKAVSEGLGDERLDEFTVECGRPDTISPEKLNVLKKYGVNRVSVNPQSLNNEVLVKIGRSHTVEDFFEAYDLVKQQSFGAVNTDLIAGLDGDSIESFESTVDKIIELEPQNVTVHTFSVKKSAQILRDDQDIHKKDGEFATQSVDYAYKALVSAGYEPYYLYRQKNTISDLENVGYAKKGTFGIYNVLMMGDGHTVFGIGAGSTTKLVKDVDGKKTILRIFSPKYPYEYLQDNQNIDAKVNDFLAKGSNYEND